MTRSLEYEVYILGRKKNIDFGSHAIKFDGQFAWIVWVG